MWGVAGVLVACFWGWLATATGPWTGSERFLWTLVDITCPIALLRGHQLSLYVVIAMNALTYVIVGLGFELLTPRTVTPTHR